MCFKEQMATEDNLSEDILRRNNFPAHIRDIIMGRSSAPPRRSWAKLMAKDPDPVEPHVMAVINARSSHVDVVENPNTGRKHMLVISLWIGYLDQFFPGEYDGRSYFLKSTFTQHFIGFFTAKVARTRGQNGNRYMAISTLRTLAESFLGVVCRYALDPLHRHAGSQLIAVEGFYTKVGNLVKQRKFSSTLVHIVRGADPRPIHHSHQ